VTGHDAIVDHVLQLMRLPAPVIEGPIGEEIDLDTLGERDQAGLRVELLGSTPTERVFNGPLDWTTRLALTIVARGDDRTAGGRASRTVHNLVHKRLRADPSFGGRLEYLGAPELAFEGQGAGSKLGTCTAIYPLAHRTSSNDLEA
jgi:hypothetical protein